MNDKSTGVLVSTLTVLLMANPVLSRAQAQQQWIAECPECAKHLGGSGVAGPYPSKDVCEQYVDRMKAQGFPFGPCHPVGSAGEGTGIPGKLHLNRPLFTVLGVGAGALVGYAFFGGTTNTEPRASLTGAAVGGVACFTLATLVNHSNFAPQNGSPFTNPNNFAGQHELPFAIPNNFVTHRGLPFVSQRAYVFSIPVPFDLGKTLLRKIHRHQKATEFAFR